FQVNFLKKPPVIIYNIFYEKYELELDLNITEVAPESPDGKRKVTGLKAVQFAPFGFHGPIPTQFGAVRSASGPAPVPAEVVFQRHLDNSLSFAQNWHGYVKGFGDPNGNYWMGLEQLLDLTKDRNCKLIYEGVQLNGKVLRAKFKGFGLRGADENYKLVLGDQEPGGDLSSEVAAYHNGMQFSTYDADNDKRSGGACMQSQESYVEVHKEHEAVLQLHLRRTCWTGTCWGLRSLRLCNFHLIK
uniref:Fibrinogen C-terminal domain-containing protein n=1 Tax=Macrostomum lignano TaxID=282301 RepID=A0A1I8I7W4_9PLAT